MAVSSRSALEQASSLNLEMTIQVDDAEKNQSGVNEFDYSERAQWLRAAVLGANDGLISVSSLMIGIGAVKTAIKAMLLAGFAGLIAGACSMAIGEFVSVYTQRDIEKAQSKRNQNQKRVTNTSVENDDEKEPEREALPNPAQAAIASALAFTVGGLVPLLGSAFIKDHKARLAAVVAVASVALAVFGGVGAALGRTPVVKSSVRVLVGGWMAMAITFGLTKLIGFGGLQM